MKSTTSIFDRLSGYFFLTGFITSKLKSIPIAIVAVIFNLVSLFAYLIGYVAWYLAAHIHPEHPRKKEDWYGFAQFKDQYKIAALLGTIATIATILSIIAPPLIIPTAWVYTISNSIWSISEHHKINNPPPNDIHFSSTKQSHYLKYALLVASSSAITALAATVVFLFPASAFIIVTGSTLVGTALTIASLYYWGKCAFGKHPPDKLNHTYNTLSRELSFELENKPKLDDVSLVEARTEKLTPRAVHTDLQSVVDEVVADPVIHASP